MKLVQLRIYKEVATRGSFTAAAEALMMSQPGASLQVKALETHFGVRLLDRTATGVKVTEAGAIVLDSVVTILAETERMERLVADIRGARRGRIVVAANTTGGMYVVPPVIAAFCEAEPEVDVVLQIEPTERIYERVEQGIVDIALVGGPNDPERFAVRRFCPDTLVLIAHPTYPIAPRGTTLADVAKAELILPEVGSRMRALIEHTFRQARLAIRPRLVVSGTEAIKRAVASRLGVGFVSVFAVTEEVRAGILRIVPLRDTDLSRDYELIARRDRYVSPALAAFTAFAIAQGADLSPQAALARAGGRT